VTYVKELTQNLSGGSEINHINRHSGGPNVGSGTSPNNCECLTAVIREGKARLLTVVVLNGMDSLRPKTSILIQMS